MSATLNFQPDAATVACPHGRTRADAASGDGRAMLEARALVQHAVNTACDCWRALVTTDRSQALHDLAHEGGARCAHAANAPEGV